MKKVLLNNWRLKLVALLVSLGLWLYIYREHNPRFSITHQVPIRYENKDKALHLEKAPASIQVEFKGSPEDIESIDSNKLQALADLGGLDAGRHSIKLIINHDSSAQVADRNLKVTVVLERLNSIERPLTVIPIGSLPIDKRLGAVRPRRDTVTFYGFESSLDKITDATISLYLTEQTESFSVRLPVEARDKFGNVVNDVTGEPEEVTVDVAVNNANTRIVPVNLNFNMGLDTNRVVAEYNPTTVTLFGKESALVNIENVTTETIDTKECVAGATFDVDIRLPRNVFSADDAVSVTCREPRTVERTFTVNLEVKNLPDGYEASLQRSKFEVTITGDAVDLDQLKLEQIIAVLDMRDASGEGTHQVLPAITVTGTEGDLSLKYDQSPITVTLKKK